MPSITANLRQHLHLYHLNYTLPIIHPITSRSYYSYRSCLIEAKPTELDKFLQHCDELIAETRKENGCLSYHLYQNTQQPNQVSFIELWQNQAVLDTHSASAHFTRIVPTLVEACEKAPVIQLPRIK